MNEEAFYIGTDTTIVLSNLRDSITGTLISDATIAGVLYTATGDAVSGGTVSITATATAGEYSGSLSDSIALVAGNQYYLKVTVTKSPKVLVFHIVRFARYYSE